MQTTFISAFELNTNECRAVYAFRFQIFIHIKGKKSNVELAVQPTFSSAFKLNKNKYTAAYAFHIQIDIRIKGKKSNVEQAM